MSGDVGQALSPANSFRGSIPKTVQHPRRAGQLRDESDRYKIQV